MVDEFFAYYGISFLMALSALFAIIYSGKKLKCKFQILPRIIKLYLIVCTFPCVFAINFCSIYAGLFYFIWGSQASLSTEIARLAVTFATQQIRFSLFVIMIERIIATLRFEKYKCSSRISMFWGLTISTYGVSVFYVAFTSLMLYFPPLVVLKFLPIWVIFSTHIITLLVCGILYYSNQKMYKKYAYQINLQQRYQIFENIKVLSYIFAPIFVYTIIAPLGSVITLITVNFFSYTSMPYSVFHIFYNLSFLIIIIHQLYVTKASPSTTVVIKTVAATVTNPFGKNLPANMTSEKYFQDLQKQWI